VIPRSTGTSAPSMLGAIRLIAARKHLALRKQPGRMTGWTVSYLSSKANFEMLSARRTLQLRDNPYEHRRCAIVFRLGPLTSPCDSARDEARTHIAGNLGSADASQIIEENEAHRSKGRITRPLCVWRKES
jgi:hypothetical protein